MSFQVKKYGRQYFPKVAPTIVPIPRARLRKHDFDTPALERSVYVPSHCLGGLLSGESYVMGLLRRDHKSQLIQLILVFYCCTTDYQKQWLKIRRLIIKKSINKCWRGCEEKETLLH